MHTLEVKDAKIMRIALHQGIVQFKELPYDHRVHGILLVCFGLSCPEVAKLFGHWPRALLCWVRGFEEKRATSDSRTSVIFNSPDQGTLCGCLPKP